MREVVVDAKGMMATNGGSMLIYNMLDQLAFELGYAHGAQDLIGEEHAVNVELLQIVVERLEKARQLKELETIAREKELRAKIRAEIVREMEIDMAYG